MRRMNWVTLLVLGGLSTAGVLVGVTGCSSSPDVERAGETDVGQIELQLTNVPPDVQSLKVTIKGTRDVVKLLDVTPGTSSTYSISGLPIGLVKVSAEAFPTTSQKVAEDATPTWVTEKAETVRVDPIDVNTVKLKLVRNGRLEAEVDFEDGQLKYVIPAAEGVITKVLFTTGDSVNVKPDGTTPYRFVGIPDGLGGFDNGDGTFTLLSNHELGNGAGIKRAHGGDGTFVSKWIIRKNDLTALEGSVLIQQVALFDGASATYKEPAKGVNLGRFCSADLALKSAWYDEATDTGYDDYLYLNGEETGNDGKPFAHALDGTSYELARLGNASWENLVANPGTGLTTAVVGLDDSTPGQVYVYIGTKTNSGSPVDRAGLTNGLLYGIAAVGYTQEGSGATAIPTTGTTPFVLAPLGNVEAIDGNAIEAASNSAGITRFNRPEDGAWDVTNPTDFYFVTTASFTTPSKLWRARFSDLDDLTKGGTLEVLLDGTEGGKMFDNIAVDKKGHVYLVEDVGGNAHLGKIWRYTIATDAFDLIATHDPALFTRGAARFITEDEEATGIIDASDLIGPGWFLFNVQAHHSAETELVEGGQLLALFDPAAK